MAHNVLVVAHLVSAPVPVQPISGRHALCIVTQDVDGPHNQLVITDPELAPTALQCRPGDLLLVEGSGATARDRQLPLVPTIRASKILRLSPAPLAPQTRHYTAIIRWQSDQDPSWELETRHSGFPSADAAALYAEGLAPQSAHHVVLESDGAIRLALTDESSVSIDDACVRVWRRESAPSPTVGSDDGFRAVDIKLRELALIFRRRPSFARLHFYLLSPGLRVLDASIRPGPDGRPRVRITDVARLSGGAGAPPDVAAPR